MQHTAHTSIHLTEFSCQNISEFGIGRNWNAWERAFHGVHQHQRRISSPTNTLAANDLHSSARLKISLVVFTRSFNHPTSLLRLIATRCGCVLVCYCVVHVPSVGVGWLHVFMLISLASDKGGWCERYRTEWDGEHPRVGNQRPARTPISIVEILA